MKPFLVKIITQYEIEREIDTDTKKVLSEIKKPPILVSEKVLNKDEIIAIGKNPDEYSTPEEYEKRLSKTKKSSFGQGQV